MGNVGMVCLGDFFLFFPHYSTLSLIGNKLNYRLTFPRLSLFCP